MTERYEKALADFKARQLAGEHMPCPRCGLDAMKTPAHTNAMSRAADIYICDACGTNEAMQAYMKQGYPLSCWAAFQPARPSGDFYTRPAGVALPEITGTQLSELTRIYKLCQDDPDNAEWYRLEAFEKCPGLTELWTQPFQANYRACDGTVLIRLKTDEAGNIQMAANIIDK